MASAGGVVVLAFVLALVACTFIALARRRSRRPSFERTRGAPGTRDGHHAPDVKTRELFRTYVAAKAAVGESVDGLTVERFAERLELRQRELEAQHGGPVKFQVHVSGGRVALRPVRGTAWVLSAEAQEG